MALPSLAKTQQFQVNQALAALGSPIADARALLLALKNSLIGAGTWKDSNGSTIGSPAGFCTVRYSCDASAAGTAGDGVDRWSSGSALTWANAGTAHSWIVLRQSATGLEILLSLEGATGSGDAITIYVSPSANFSGGSTTARPTATDEIALSTGGAMGLGGDANLVLHVIISSDGQCMRAFLYRANVCQSTFIFDKPKNVVSGWSNPSASLFLGNAQPNLTNLANAANFHGKGASSMVMFCTFEGFNGTSIVADQTSANDLDSNFPMMPIGLYSQTSSNRGRHGELFDLWWGLASANDGDDYPADASRQFAQIGDLIVPWNKSAIVTA